MNAARHSIMEGTKWVNPYVTDGLIAMYDGIWNAGPGRHSAATQRWANLGSLGHDYDAIRATQGEFRDDGAVFVRDNDYHAFKTVPNDLLAKHLRGEWSYEVVFTPGKGWRSNYSGVIGAHNSVQKGIVGGQYENGTVSFTLYAPDVPLYKKAATSFATGVPVAISQAASNTVRTATTWRDGVVVSRKSGVNVNLTIADVFCIGAAFSTETAYGQRTFDGVIHCVRLYNRPLTETDVEKNRVMDKARFNLTD